MSEPVSGSIPSRRRHGALLRSCVPLVAGALVALAPLAVPSPVAANPAGTGLVISEVYGGGASSGATYNQDYVELYNPTNSAIPLTGLGLQYRSATYSSGGVTVAALSGSVPAKSTFLVQTSTSTSGLGNIPTPDLITSTQLSLSGTNGQVLLLPTTTGVTATGDLAGSSAVIDMVGYGTTATTFETARTGTALTISTSASRSATGADTDSNSADFTAGTPTPQASGSSGGGGGTPEPGAPVAIAEVQGTDAASSPLAGQSVTVRGVVTAAYPTGGYNGFYVQTAGTGGATDATPGASDAVFVFTGAGLASAIPAIGTVVDVTGTVSEFSGSTQITPASAAGIVTPSGVTGAVTPAAMAYPTTEAGRESHEGELLAPTDTFTVTNSFSTNQFAEVGLATGTTPLIQPTDVARPGTPAAAAVAADNTARGVVLDDGASINFLNGTNRDIPVPYLTGTDGAPVPVRVGARATLTAPVILEFRNSTWKFQPTAQYVASAAAPATFANTRTPAPGDVGGDLKLATFNVLNYFNTTAEAFEAAGGSCTYFTDRAGTRIGANTCTPDGPRGAATAVSLGRQQAKIVAAINALGADIVSLEEIENSVKLIGETDRDDAVRTLVGALNAAAGAGTWAFAPSPAAADLPALAEQDVIRTAFIYKPAKVALVGASRVLVGAAAFSNAREPLAQAFKRVGTADSSGFLVVANHFKSTGSGGTGDNADTGDGQGFYNGDRVRQATALVSFANETAAQRGVEKIFLAGDFNSYTREDPMQVLYDAGFAAVESTVDPGESTYSFSGLSGSLDHVLANPAALATVTGADIWNINSGESVAFEYSRFNYNATDFYQAGPYRSSDHDPEVVGISAAAPAPVNLRVLTVNDFHGRINANAVRWAGTIEQLRAEAGEDHTLFVGNGDLIGASEFASAVADDQPTIDYFNALDLDATATGNHEFDRGWPDLRDRVIGPAGNRNAEYPILGANVYAKGTTTPVLPEYALEQRGGLTVAIIGAVTQETATLVSPGGITDIEFGDPVAAVNRVAAQLTDGDQANGEADVLIASLHEGATQGVGSSYAAEIARGNAFARMADLDPAIAAVINGHTHQAYAWDQPVPGEPGRTRPIIQTGQYGDNVGLIDLVIDPVTGQVTSYTERNVPRTTADPVALAQTYPRVAAAKAVVDAALTNAATVGNQPVGSVTADITTAFAGGSYAAGGYTGGTRDDRSKESTLGDLVANALRDGVPADLGAPDLGVVNPGGLRNELRFAGSVGTEGQPGYNPANTDGVITYGEANAVLPFVNNINIVTLTGAQLKAVLEQQWQPAGAQRPYLALGLSDNVRVTQDPTAPVGSRITSVYVDDQPLDPTATYRVSTFSFLATGGDNFTAFTQGTVRDTGLVDRDVWIGYLQDNAGLAPDFARQQVVTTGMPATVAGGDTVSFTASGLDLTSLGSPRNTEVQVRLVGSTGQRSVGTFPVTDGAAAISFTAPADLSGLGTGVRISLVAAPSGTVVGPVADTTAPTVSVTGGPADGAAVTSAPSYTFVSPDADVARFECALDPAGEAGYATCTSPFTVPAATADGAHTFAVRAVDTGGNTSAVVTRAFTLTKTVGTVAITSGPVDGARVATLPTYGFTTTEADVTRFECAVDAGDFATCTSPFAVTGPLADGEHTVRVRVVDTAGRTSAAVTRTFVLDRAAAAPAITSGPADGATVEAAPTYGFSSSETDVARFECALDPADGGTFATCTSPFTAPGDLEEGAHTFAVRAVDQLGTTSTATSRTFTLARPRAEVTITGGPADGAVVAATPTYRFTTTAAGASFVCRVDAKAVVPCTSPYRVPAGLKDGRHTFAVGGTDASGTPLTPVARTFVLDTTAPTVRITAGPVNGAKVTKAPVFRFASGADDLARFECKVGAGDWRTCRSPFTASGARGTRTFSVRAVDEVGNVSDPVRRTYRVVR
ncbi:ExeM/NucH family extracellular endonuclease [Nocardioides sp.]|uniref:ExeM/NucH family extracellular endonuclease n=1 Tax=Nocardioides sp. TaxID=35761 RepID=UPI0035161028